MAAGAAHWRPDFCFAPIADFQRPDVISLKRTRIIGGKGDRLLQAGYAYGQSVYRGVQRLDTG